MTLRLGGDGAITGCTSLENPDLTVSGLTISGSFDAEKVLVASGTAAAPSYTFSGDTDNGLYYAGTNSIGLSTAGTNAILIDSSGNVGIGTTNPSGRLTIKDGGYRQGIVLERSASTVDRGFIYIGDGTNSTIADEIYLDASNTAFHFRQGGTGTTETVTFKADGKVGIGDSSPNTNLVVKGASNSLTNSVGNINVISTDSAAINAGGSIGLGGFYNGTSNSIPFANLHGKKENGTGNNAAGYFAISTRNASSGTAERMRITSDGNLTAYSGSTNGNYFVIRGKHSPGNDYNRSEVRFGVENNANGLGFLAFATGNNTAYERMRINSSGNVGIGTTTIASALDVRGANDVVIGASPSSGNGEGTIFLSCVGTGTKGNIIGRSAISFQTTSNSTPVTSGTERMRIDSSGRLLVGTSTYSSTRPSGAIHLDSILTTPGFGNISLGFNGTAVGNQNVFTFYRTRGTSAGSVDIVQSGDSLGSINFNGADGVDALSAAASIKAEVDGTPGANDMPGRLMFATTADGASSPTERMRIDSAGNVAIGRTSASSKLDLQAASGRTQITLRNVGNTVDASTFVAAEELTSNNADLILAARHSVRFLSNNSEKMRIDSNGKLLLNTSTARTNYFGGSSYGALVNFESTSNPNRIVSFIHNDSSGGPMFVLGATGGSTSGNYDLVSANTTYGFFSFQGSDGTHLVEAARISAVADGTPAADDMPGRLVFYTTPDGASGPTERMRIDDEGIFYHNSSNHGISTSLTQSAGTVKYAFRAHHSGTAGNYGGTISFTVWSNGNVENTNNSYGPISSDERLKQDITDANSQWDDIKNIRIANFHYKNNPTGPLHLGPIAQELEQISPHLVTRRPVSEDEVADSSNSLVDGDEVLSFKASILYMKAVKALQEAITRIETLEAEVAALKAQ